MPRQHETFTTADGTTYQLVTNDSGAGVVHPVNGGQDIPFNEFPKQEWRSWTEDRTTGGGNAVKHNEVPASTASIPTILFKRVNVDHLDSIASEGLASTMGRVMYGGYSKGSQYMQRDLGIAGVWLSTDGVAGESMQPDSGTFIDLRVEVSSMFRDLFLRDSQAVLNNDNTTTGKTVISFAPIPKECIFLELKQDLVIRVKGIDKNSKVQAGQQPLSKLGGTDIKKLIQAIKSNLNKDDDNDW